MPAGVSPPGIDKPRDRRLRIGTGRLSWALPASLCYPWIVVLEQRRLCGLYSMLFEQLRALFLTLPTRLSTSHKRKDSLGRWAEQGRDVALDFTQPDRPVCL